jgi:putative two-component system response regulator
VRGPLKAAVTGTFHANLPPKEADYERRIRQAKILLVDERDLKLARLERHLRKRGFENVSRLDQTDRLARVCRELEPDLLVIDMQILRPHGPQVIDRLAPLIESRGLQILAVASEPNRHDRQLALALGVQDYVGKPVGSQEFDLSVRALIERQQMQRSLEDENKTLATRVQESREDLEDARTELLERLALAAEFRDDDTHEHTQRVGRTAAALAESVGLSTAEIELVRRAAPLHDIGKVGVSDTILLKPGKLSPEEYEVMQQHVPIGGEILAGSRAPLLKMAAVIAMTHHEWWNGMGYPLKLSQSEIPVWGRITALADVFDALTHERPYKAAWPLKRTLTEIRRSSGAQFDPDLVEAFLTLNHEELLSAIR